ncbi:hypothetical protein C3L29_036560, partial [Pseudomonas sp. MWU12-2534b]
QRAVSADKTHALLAERYSQLNSTFPDDYLTFYRQNLQAFDAEAAQRKERTLQLYKDEYLLRLRRLKDEDLEQRAQPEDKSAKSTNVAALEEYKSMTLYYFGASKRVMLETIDHHLERMAQMDGHYGVCVRYADCWRR